MNSPSTINSRLLLLALVPSTVLSQCTTCNQQTNGQYGTYIYGSYLLGPSGSSPSPQYDQGQYMCNSCQTSSSGSQYSCNSCQYSPSLQTTTMSPSYSNLGQCTCNNCQLVQGVQYSAPQYSCSSCQQTYQSNSFSSTVSPSNQIYRDSTSNLGIYSECPTCQNSNGMSSTSSYGYSTTVSPYATQQYRNPGSACPSCQQSYGSSSTASPYRNQQLYNPSSATGCPTCQQSYSYGSSSTASPYSNQKMYNPSTQWNSCPSCQTSYASSTAAPSVNRQFRNPTTQYANGFSASSTPSPFGNQQFQDQASLSNSPTSRYNDLTNTNLGFPPGYSANANTPGYQPLYDQSSANQNNDGTYVSGQYLPGTQGHVYDTRVGLTQFNTQVKK